MNRFNNTHDDATVVHHDSLISTNSSSSSTMMDWSTPLLLSTMAGLSTCIGAAIVFCLDHHPSIDKGGKRRNTAVTSSKVGPSHMAFSLMMAGSVMITVSMASILPESFLLDDDIHYTPFGSVDFCQRIIAFGAGCGLYMMLSKFVFPAPPDEIIGSTFISGKDDTVPNSVALGDPLISGSELSLILLLEDDERMLDRNSNSFPLLPVVVTSSSVKGPMTSNTLQRKKNIGSSSFDSLDEPTTGNASSLSANQKLICSTGKGKSNANLWNFTYMTRYMRGTDLMDQEARRKWRVTMLLLISLAVHNFPEGLAVAASALHSPGLGITTTIAIALHNIPEGIAIAIPCLAARPDWPWLAFALASLSGLAEPMGAVVALLVIDRSSGDTDANQEVASIYLLLWKATINMKNVLGFVAGIMMTVAVMELFPEARRHMKESPVPGILGGLMGAVVMLASDAYL